MTSPFQEGDPGSKICIIGEAPSHTEMRIGKPFVGPAGHVLDQCMHAAGMIRRECYLTNVFEEPVTKDKLGGKIWDSAGDLVWTNKGGFTADGEKHLDSLLVRLARSKANVFVPLGNTALSALTPHAQIMKWRGSILSSPVIGKKVVATIHPAASLRGQYIWRYIITADLRRVIEERHSPNLNLPERTLRIDPSFDEVISYLKECLEQEDVALDIEIYRHQVSCLGFAIAPDDAMCIPLVGMDGKARWSIDQEMEIWQLTAQILNDPSIRTINQNLSFDISVLLQQNSIITQGELGDTMVAQHLLYPDFPKGLDFIASIHTREPYWKDDGGKMWKKMDGDYHTFWRYNAKDACVAMEAWYALEAELHERGYWHSYEETIKLVDPLVYMMIRGFGVNLEALAKTKAEVEAKIAEKEADLLEVAERPFNPASPKQCMEYFYVTKGIKPYVNRKTGKPTTDDKAMARIVRRFNLPEARLVQEIRSLKKLHGTYLSADVDGDHRMRCSYNIRGTTTGRLSSSQTIFGTGMNMQNIHPEFKSFLVADDV
jgi:uracil-DNA glycosylase|tara:strand:- start:1490 stop:3121 length:1632 start_codon:yes stop_codon:yes gene_type:complete